MPTAASASPMQIETTIFALSSLPVPMKLQKVSRYTAKNSGGPKRSAKLAMMGATKVMSRTPKPVSRSLNSSKVGYPMQTQWPTEVRVGAHSGEAQAQYPNHCSSGPFGSGTVNWYSNSQKMTALMMMGTTMLFVHP